MAKSSPHSLHPLFLGLMPVFLTAVFVLQGTKDTFPNSYESMSLMSLSRLLRVLLMLRSSVSSHLLKVELIPGYARPGRNVQFIYNWENNRMPRRFVATIKCVSPVWHMITPRKFQLLPTGGPVNVYFYSIAASYI